MAPPARRPHPDETPPWRVLALFGPTGIGKTDVAVALGDRLRARGARPVAVSADALQVYAGLGVVTGAATPDQRRRLDHRLVGMLPVSESFSAGAYAGRAHAEIDGLLAQGSVPIVVGGTGLYLRAALADLDLQPPVPPEVRAALNDELTAHGAPALHERLRAVAPATAATIEPNDAQRVVRALELVAVGSGTKPANGESQLWTRTTRHPTRLVGLTMDREALYARIDARVLAMVAAGAADEVRAAVAAGAAATARKALGFDELPSGDVEALQRRTRNFAKRQLTWMRKLTHAELIDVTGRDPDDVAAEILA
jgi:tRNA dimethylallyltransferase